MPSKISRVAFCGLRRLNTYRNQKAIADPLWDMFGEWLDDKEWYHFGKVNVFIGNNGSGKSTVLELLDVLRDASRLCNIFRENRTSIAPAAFVIDFDNARRLTAHADPIARRRLESASNLDGNGINGQATFLQGMTLDACGEPDRNLFRDSRNLSKLELDDDSRARISNHLSIFDCNVVWWDASGGLDSAGLVRVLNDAQGHLTGLLSSMSEVPSSDDRFGVFYELTQPEPFRLRDDDRLEVWLGDDPHQTNIVQIATLPSGWLQLASIIGWLESQTKGTICLLEEPEIHLHPRLQRYLINRMYKIAFDNELQLFVTTHSTTFQDPAAWGSEADDVRVFEATGDRLDASLNPVRLLDALGIRGADVSQSNGVIWVEGASDRIYIKHWLELWCAANGHRMPREHVEFSFMYYGGAVLSHFSVAETDEFVSMLRLNRNMAIIIDRDRDFEHLLDGTLRCLHPLSAKGRILNELGKVGSGNIVSWVTSGYTIESDLPAAFRQLYFREDENDRLVLLQLSLSKVVIAQKYKASHVVFESCVEAPALLSQNLERIFAAIQRWNY